MKLINKSTDLLKRTDSHGRFVRIAPGGDIEVTDAEGEYLLKHEKHHWEREKPAPKTKPKKEAD